MPDEFDTLVIGGLTEAETPKRYVKKADRGFAPEGSPLRPSRFDLAGRFYRLAAAEDIERQASHRQRAVYASGITECRRKTVFSLWGLSGAIPEKVRDNPQYRITAKIGNLIHQLVTEFLGQEGLLVSSEFSVTDPGGAVRGRVDNKISLAVKEKLDDSIFTVRFERALVDVKSVDKKYFEDGPYSDKFDKYIDQLNLYLYLEGVELGVICLICRADGRIADYEFSVDKERAKQLIARAAGTINIANKRIVPPAEAWGTWECGFCWYKDWCEAEQQALVVTGGLRDGTITVLTPEEDDLEPFSFRGISEGSGTDAGIGPGHPSERQTLVSAGARIYDSA